MAERTSAGRAVAALASAAVTERVSAGRAVAERAAVGRVAVERVGQGRRARSVFGMPLRFLLCAFRVHAEFLKG
ncbi:hypothetical protein ACFY1V_09860 [Streptomyces sp. NPDC001255]|uniref:hypothetical protein n=1 Tax=Streptomyces sp. NPDC001255 TaxID=3364550 RepID=UPI0036B7246A